MDAPLTVAIGGSAGAVEALRVLAGGLPADLPACVLVTVHIGEQAESKLPNILGRAGPLPAAHARHGEILRPGRIYVAPPGYHLLTASGRARLSNGPRVNRHRPAIDVMFASAARWADGGTVAVVLSGTLDDGAVGSALVSEAGGHVLVQEPREAPFDPMPRAALAATPEAKAVATAQLSHIAASIVDRGGRQTAGAPPATERRALNEALQDPLHSSEAERMATQLACPECSGALAKVDLGGISYYSCHVGHHFGPNTLEAAQRESAEARLWSAVAALEEHASLARHLADSATQESRPDAAEYLKRSHHSGRLARSVRSTMFSADLADEPNSD